MIKKINWDNAFVDPEGTLEVCPMPLGFTVAIITDPWYPGLWGWRVTRHWYNDASDPWAAGVVDSRAAAEESCQQAWDKIASRVLEGHEEIVSVDIYSGEHVAWVVGGTDYNEWFCPMCGKVVKE